MDETTVECDVLVRRNLLRHLKEKTIKENSTILYATHVFDGNESFWFYLDFEV
jgi:CCR4-NOT complex subunit CAF16